MDLTKYEILINDLSSIEAEVATLGDALKDNANRTVEMEETARRLKQENSLLKSKITELEIAIENVKSEPDTFNLLNTKERDTLKTKLQDLISRIDYHLSAEH